MSATVMLAQWRVAVKEDLLSVLHGHQSKALADLSLGMAISGDCRSGIVAAAVPGSAQVASVQRRWERLLANRRVPVEKAMQQMSAAILERWSGRQILLILDETPKANDLRCLKLCAAYHKRAVPLMCLCYRGNDLPASLPKLVWKLLSRVRKCLPEDCRVTLLTDRGLAWPTVLDLCDQFSWHYVLRVQHTTRVRLADRSICGMDECSIGELVQRAGDCRLCSGEVFKKAGWRASNIVAMWQTGEEKPWLLITDQPPRKRWTDWYAKRTWCEESFRDEKSSGFAWQRSQVNDPKHAMRLMLLLALAMLLAISLGSAVLKRGLRKTLQSGRVRKLSVFQLGLRWIRHALSNDKRICCRVYLYPA